MPLSVKPLVYSCSGCSGAAQMANHLALMLDRDGLCQMSCIAGVGGDVQSLVRLASSGRFIIAIDGCRLGCVRACLARHNVTPERHYQLADLGVHKGLGEVFDPASAERIYRYLAADLSRSPFADTRDCAYSINPAQGVAELA